MSLLKHMLVKLLLSSILLIGCMGQTVFAKTDDAGVLAGLESNSDMYSYLNYLPLFLMASGSSLF